MTGESAPEESSSLRPSRKRQSSLSPSRRRFLALATAGLGVLAGCGYRPGGGDVRWEIEVTGGRYSPDDVLVTNGTLFTVSRSVRGFDFETEEWGESAHISAYGATSGEKLWDDRTAPVGRPAVGGESLYLGHEDGDLAATDVTGTTRWQVSVGDFPHLAAASEDRVYALTDAGDLLAFDAADGEQLWHHSIGATDAALTATREGVLVHHRTETRSAAVVSVGRDGEREWEAELPEGGGFRRGSPAVSDEAVYASGRRNLFALSREDGRERWSHEVRGLFEDPPAIADGTLYCATSRELRALDVEDGDVRWRFQPTGRGDVSTPPAVTDGSVYVGDTRALYAVDARDGEIRWEVESGSPIGPPLVVGPTVVVATNDGVVRAHWRE